MQIGVTVSLSQEMVNRYGVAGTGPPARAARRAGVGGGAAAGVAARGRRERRAARAHPPRTPRLRPAPPHLRRRHAASRPPHTTHGRHGLTRTRCLSVPRHGHPSLFQCHHRYSTIPIGIAGMYEAGDPSLLLIGNSLSYHSKRGLILDSEKMMDRFWK